MRLFAILPAIALALPGETAVRTLAPGVTVVQGAVNGVLIERNGRVLAIYGDPRGGPSSAERVLFTHHRRDVVWAGRRMALRSAEAFVPAAEEPLFARPGQFWDRWHEARFHDYTPQTVRILTAPIPDVRTVRGGGRIDWQSLATAVLDTPGYTRGAVSYAFEAGGKRIACTGDLIFGDGHILDLYSLQDAIPQPKEDGYHGYGARAAELIASLRRVAAWKPDVLVPARGPLIEDPQASIVRLIERLQAVFASHFAIDALRWYRGDENLRGQAARILGAQPVEWMPRGETRAQLPEWILPIDNSRLIVSRSGASFLIDCGSRRILDEVKKHRPVEGIWITHYHDDHTDQAEAAAEELHCPVYACPQMRDVLEHPGAYRLPAQTANAIRNVKTPGDGASWHWHEFEFTSFYFPGQTLYHGGLLVKQDGGESVFFLGDSFTPTGMDDYCLFNRNFLPPEPGFLECLQLLKKHPDWLLINQHVAPAFRFSPQQLDLMGANFAHRRELMAALFPWDDPNYGLDHDWARFYPYAIQTPAGRPFQMQFIVRNHSPRAAEYSIKLHVPPRWKAPDRSLRIAVDARGERAVLFPLTPGPEAWGPAVITADVEFADWSLHEWAEALVDVQ